MQMYFVRNDEINMFNHQSNITLLNQEIWFEITTIVYTYNNIAVYT